MGRLVVVNSNFSINCIETIRWYGKYTDTSLQGDHNVTSSTDYAVALQEIANLGLTNVAVKYLRLFARTAGNIIIKKCEQIGSETSWTKTDEQTISVISGINIIEITPITLSSSISLSVQGNGILTYNQTGGADKGWLFSTSPNSVSTARICIDLGVDAI